MAPRLQCDGGISCVIMTAVYIHPRANVDTAVKDLSTVISRYEFAYSDALTIVGGDFNQANLRSWPSGLAYRTQVLVLAAECGFESRP